MKKNIVVTISIILLFAGMSWADIHKKELKLYDGVGKLNFIISTYVEHCGYKNLKEKYKCNLFKPLISNNLIN